MEIVLWWMLIGLIAALFTKSRGRFGVKWFFLSLILGPFGFVLTFMPLKKKQG
jgi:fatty acid desaturase